MGLRAGSLKKLSLLLYQFLVPLMVVEMHKTSLGKQER
jgi:hypothetical protein